MLSARLLREAKAMAQLRHPNVVAVYEAGVDELGRVYMVMEAVAGETLRQVLERRRLSWRERVDLFMAAGAGLAAAHQAGFVHRDFKPENVFVGEDGRVCVGDFGLVSPGFEVAAVTAVSDSKQTTVMGTPAYMPPEQCHGLPVDSRTDQFALCVALWEALYGELPFRWEGPDQYLAAIENGALRQPPPDRKVPAWVADVLARGLAADPRDRYPTTETLLSEFARDQFHGGGLVAVGALVIGLIGLTLLTLYIPPTWSGLLACEFGALLATILFKLFKHEWIERSTMHRRSAHLVMAGAATLPVLTGGAWLAGLSPPQLFALSPFQLTLMAVTGVLTVDLVLLPLAILDVIAFLGAALFPAAAPVLLAIANSAVFAIAYALHLKAGTAPPRKPSARELAVAGAGGLIGRFEVLRILRESHDEALIEAHDPRLKRRVILHLGSGDLGYARGLAQLRHANLVTVYEIGVHQRRTYVVCEWVAGRTLREELNEDPERTWREIVDNFAAAGRGLAAAHRAGFVHRAFSADRVFLGEDGRILLGGFGFGPPGFEEQQAQIAPEVLRGWPADAASDQFTFCATLWNALYGAPPFFDLDVDGYLSVVREGPPAPPAGSRVPAWFATVLARGLSFEPAERYASMDALLAALNPNADESAHSRRNLATAASYLPLALAPLCASGFELSSAVPFSNGQIAALSAACLFAYIAFQLWLGRPPTRAMPHRWAYWIPLVVLGGSILLALGAEVSGLPARMVELMQIAAWASVCAGTAITVERRLWPCAAFAVAAFGLGCALPALVYPITAAVGIACAANVGWLARS
jgi:serine/threonine protein kinase